MPGLGKKFRKHDILNYEFKTKDCRILQMHYIVYFDLYRTKIHGMPLKHYIKENVFLIILILL